ncbi:MAG TPA: cytochrome b [Xanthomonadales bacterium]|nr:cytochrome b [Xanthomonadales bacterium]
MPLRNTPTTWGSVHKALHWLVALAVIGMVVVGWVMDELPSSPDKVKVYALHKSTGLTVLALMLLRLAWRWSNPRPALPDAMPRWERALAGVVHVGLYVVLIAMPLTGWLYNSAANFPLRWFWLFPVPALWGPDPDVKHFAEDAHELLSWVLVGLFTLHVAGALKHHFVDRDVVLRRMLPSFRRGDAAPPPEPPP